MTIPNMFWVMLVLGSAILESFTVAQYPTDPQPLSIHILDNEFGGEAANMSCRLYRLVGEEFQHLSSQVTNDNGRIPEFLSAADADPGTYRVWCASKEYFAARNLTTFFPYLQTTFDILDPRKDYHVVWLLSRFAFNCHRGVLIPPD